MVASVEGKEGVSCVDGWWLKRTWLYIQSLISFKKKKKDWKPRWLTVVDSGRWAWMLYCSVNFIFLFLKVKIIMFLKWKSYIIRTDDWNFAEWEANKQKVFGICRFGQTSWISRRHMWASQAGFSCWVYATFRCFVKLLLASGSLHMSKFMPSTGYPTPEDTHPTSSHSSSSSIQSLSCVWLFETPWTAARQASLSITNSQSLLKSCPLSQWCHPTISSSVIPFSCLQSFPASGSSQMSQPFLSASGGQSIGVSASTSVLPMNTQDWFPLGWTGWISLQSKGLSRVFSNTTVQKHQFFSIQ